MGGKWPASVVLVSMLMALPCAADALADFRVGIEAFNAQDYNAALIGFKRAETLGMHSDTLYYNLGSTYYKLGRYAQAKTSYARLLQRASWRALAEYNLGLIAAAEGDPVMARRHYLLAYENANVPKLKLLILDKLDDYDVFGDAGKEWWGSIGIGFGRDDNAVFAADSAAALNDGEGDTFREFSASAGRYLSGNPNSGYRFDVTGYRRTYTSAHVFDFNAWSAALTRDQKIGAWSNQIGIKADALFADHSAYSRSAALRLQTYRAYSLWALRLSNDYSRIQGGTDFQHLTGWRNQSTLEAIYDGFSQSTLRMGYQWEINARKNIQGFDESDASYGFSPTRQKLFLAWMYRLGLHWSVEARADYWHSRYGDRESVLNANDEFVERARTDNLQQLTLRVNYRRADGWEPFLDYRYTRNRSNIEDYEYIDNQVMLGLNYHF